MASPKYILVETPTGHIVVPVDDRDIVAIRGTEVETNITSTISVDQPQPRDVEKPRPPWRSRLD